MRAIVGQRLVTDALEGRQPMVTCYHPLPDHIGDATVPVKLRALAKELNGKTMRRDKCFQLVSDCRTDAWREMRITSDTVFVTRNTALLLRPEACAFHFLPIIQCAPRDADIATLRNQIPEWAAIDAEYRFALPHGNMLSPSLVRYPQAVEVFEKILREPMSLRRLADSCFAADVLSTYERERDLIWATLRSGGEACAVTIGALRYVPASGATAWANT